MATLVWDKVGDRRYETGIDRGVLYLPGGGSVAWNGLVSIKENLGRDIKSYYMDGVKYLDHVVPGSYSANLQAYTYPEALDDFLGNTELVPGVITHDQRTKSFALSYRTRIANDIEGLDYGYRIHVVYNVQAFPNDFSVETLSESPDLQPIEWNLTSTPSVVFGAYPTSHISLNSLRIAPPLLSMLEGRLYGTSSADPSLPELIEFLNIVEGF